MKMRLAVVVLLLTGCSARADVERDVAAVMKDSESVRFGEITVRGEGIGRVACGQVNAKNSFGAYTGDQWFLARGGMLYTPIDGVCCKLALVEPREGTDAIRDKCEASLPEPVLIDQ